MMTAVEVAATLFAVVISILFFARPTWALWLLVATFPFNIWAPRLPVPGLNTETIMIGIAVALVLVRFRMRLPPLALSGPPIAYILVIFMGLVLALPWARQMTTTASGDSAIWAIFKIAKSITFMTLVFFPVYWFFEERGQRRQLLEAISVSTSINAALTILDGAITFNPEAAGSGRAIGIFLDPNACCQFLASTMLVSYVLVVDREIPPLRRAFHAATYGMAWVAVILTLSRGGWLGAIAGHFIFLLFMNRTLAVAGVTALVLFATAAYPFLPENVRGRIEGTQRSGLMMYNVPGAQYLEGSAATRLVYYNILVDMFVERPIWGHGLYAFSLRTPEWGAKYGMLRRRDPHSLFIRMASEQGLIGIAVFVWMWLTLLVVGRRLWDEGVEEKTLGALGWGVVATLGVANLTTSSFLYTKAVSFYYWVIYALISRAYLAREETEIEAEYEVVDDLEGATPIRYGWARPDEAR